MLKRSLRLAEARKIKLVFARGSRATTPHLRLQCLAHPRGTRFAVIVSKKIAKNASDRNRFKRILREAIRATLFAFRVSGDYILSYRGTPEAELRSTALEEEILQCLKSWPRG